MAPTILHSGAMHRAAVLLAIMIAASTARAGDPQRQWRTIETAHFVVTYYAPLDEVAHRVAVVAERAHRNLAPALDHEPSEKTQILLVDDTDGANGFANVLPRNEITLFATAPTGSSNLADHDDWLLGLVSHEYTHVIHLDTIGGLPDLVNHVVGKVWAPNQIQPRWIIEGIATYEETKRTAGGRNRNTTFDMYLRVPTLDGTALSLDQVTGLPLYFPQGNAAYLYGSHFLRYVFDRYGDRALRDMSHGMGSDPIPFGINRQIDRVVGKPFTELYDDWRAYLRDRAALQVEAVDRNTRREGRALTTSSTANLAPFYTYDGKELIWSQSDGWSQPRLRAMPVGGDATKARDVLAQDRMGGFAVGPDGDIVFEQTQQWRLVYNFQERARSASSASRAARARAIPRSRPTASTSRSARTARRDRGSRSPRRGRARRSSRCGRARASIRRTRRRGRPTAARSRSARGAPAAIATCWSPTSRRGSRPRSRTIARSTAIRRGAPTAGGCSSRAIAPASRTCTRASSRPARPGR